MKIKAQKRKDEIINKSYHLFIVCIFFSVLLKYEFITKMYQDYLVEFVTMITGVGYVAVCKGINLKQGKEKSKSQELEFDRKSKGFTIMLLSMLAGEVLYFYLGGNWKLACLYLPVWMIPTLYLCVCMLGKRTEQAESKCDGKRALRQLKIRTAIGSLAYGILVFGESAYSGGEFHPLGLLWILYGAAAFGIILYFVMKYTIYRNVKE